MDTDLTIASRTTLNNGAAMPVLGFGTWMATGRDAAQSVLWALEAGYRLIDSAAAYGNEAEVGAAIRRSGVPREEVFVTTKLWTNAQGYDSALRAFDASRTRLGLGPVDLYLIHWPAGSRSLRRESWRALETIYASGGCRAIGVSNYEIGHLEEVLDDGKVAPAVNQVEFSPFVHPRKLHAFCAEHGILVEAYGPLRRGHGLKGARLRDIAERHGRTPAQILLRWAVQKKVVPIPKSVHQDRILENAAVFDFTLGPEDMAVLDGLG